MAGEARNPHPPIAIVGIGCRFPGGADDASSFWRLLSEGRNAVGAVPPDRIDLSHFFDERPATPGRIMSRWGGFLDHVDMFDAAFFGISPREAERMDPQQRLVLETAWEALEDAGQNVTRLSGGQTGVFLGQWLSDFEARLFADPEETDFYMTTGSGRYATSGRLSYLLGLQGPSMTIDTACSSSLVAVHLAVRSLRDGDCDLALAGGVNVILQPHISVAYSQSRMMAPDGRCKFGDASGDGYVRSEGAGIVALKRLDQAVADGDRVYAVIRGSAVNNDGRSSGSMGTPSRIGQEALLRSALRDAGIAPARVGYVEAHGTGTRAGDPVELGALGAVLGEGRAAGERALVGSVKTNIGHTEGAAGVAGLIKAALALHHRSVPASLHCHDLNPAVAWNDAPFAIARQTQPWPDGPAPRVAGVSAFGIAGTNAHVVMEEAPTAVPVAPRAEACGPDAMALLPLSARSAEALRALASRYSDCLAGDESGSLQEWCANAAAYRATLDHRAAFVASTATEMSDALREFSRGETAAAPAVQDGSPPRVVFVVPGQGAQWLGMGRQLMATQPAFRAALQQCDAAAKPHVSWSVVEQLQLAGDAPGYLLDRIDVIQPVLVALSIAYAALWRSKGVVPDAVVGHSMGEVGAAAIAGVLDLDQAMHVVCLRSVLMRRTSGQGAMALVELSMDEARKCLRGREAELSVAVSNSPRSSVISGDPTAVAEVMAGLERDGVFCRLVKVDVASHSPQMAPLAADLEAELAGLAPRAGALPVYSTVLARRAEGHEFDASYWARNLRQPVMFAQTIGQLVADGFTVFVELGPHPVLLPAVEQTAQSLGVAATTIGCGRRDEPGQRSFLDAAAALWASGARIDGSLFMPAPSIRLPLPLYAWQRERHWVDSADRRGHSAAATTVAVPDDEALGWLHRLQWRPAQPAARATEAVRRHWLLVADDLTEGSRWIEAMAGAGANVALSSLADLASSIKQRRTTDDAFAGILVLACSDRDAAYLPLQALQAVDGDTAASLPRLWFVTRGAQSVEAAPTERVHPDQAALWGAARAIGEEHPDRWGGLVDLDPSAGLASNAAALLGHLLAADGEDQVAFRGGQRFVLRLATEKRDKTPAFAWRPDASYLITGGLGDIGLHVAKAMAAQGARRIVLVGRTALPARDQWLATPAGSPAGQRIAAIRALEAQGVAVHVASVDVSDEAALRSFLDRHASEGWPPIRGVVHAAGSFGNDLAVRMGRDAFDAVVRPKLLGAQLLDRLLPDLDLFVMFSSTGAFLVQPGQANYAAANAGLDAIAFDRQARGLPATSIAWGVWQDTGLVKNAAGARNVGEMARQGIHPFTPERGAAMFAWLCGQPQATTVVLPIDWAAYRRARAGRDLPLMRELIGSGDDTTTADDGNLAARLAEAGLAERRRLLDGVVRDAVGRVLKIAPSRLDPRKALGSLGLNSLMAMELRNRLEAALQRSLSATLAWNHPSVEALVSHLAGGGVAAAQIAAPACAPAALPHDMALQLDALVDLSDDQAATALRTTRRRS